MVDPDVAASHETYATRKSVLEAETIWRLTADSLVRERIGEPPTSAWSKMFKIGWRILFPFARPMGSDNWPDRLPYREIVSVRVRYDPTRFDRGRERCDLTGPSGARVSIFSTSYESFARFRDQSPEYRAFIDQLTRRVLAAHPQAALYSGLTWTSYLLQHGLLLLVILALTSVIGMAGAPAINTIWAKLIITLSYVGTLWAYSRRNLPRRLNPPGR